MPPVIRKIRPNQGYFDAELANGQSVPMDSGRLASFYQQGLVAPDAVQQFADASQGVPAGYDPAVQAAPPPVMRPLPPTPAQAALIDRVQQFNAQAIAAGQQQQAADARNPLAAVARDYAGSSTGELAAAELAARARSPRGGGGGGPLTKQVLTRQFAAQGTPEQEAQRAAIGEEIGAAQQEQAGARRQLTESVASQADAEASALEGQLTEYSGIGQQFAQDRARLTQQRDREAAQYEKDLDSQRNHPQLNANMSGGQRIMSGLAIALGAMGQAFTKGPNVGMEVVNANIERSMEEQREAFARAQGRVSARSNLLGALNERLGNLPAAEHAYRVLATERAQANLQRISASTKSEQVRANARIMEGQLAEQAAALRAQGVQQTIGTVEETQTLRSGGGGGRRPPTAAQIHQELVNRQLAQELAGGGTPEEINRQTQEIASKLASAGTGSAGEATQELRETLARPGGFPGEEIGGALVGTALSQEARQRVGRVVSSVINDLPLIGRLSPLEQTRELDRQVANISNRIKKEITGTGGSDADAERIIAGMGFTPDAGAEQLVRALDSAQRGLTATEGQVLAGQPEAAQQLYRRRLKQIQDEAQIPRGATRIGQVP